MSGSDGRVPAVRGDLRAADDVIARALRPAPPSSDVALVARQLLHRTHGFENASITTAAKIEFAGGAGYYLEAFAGQRTIVQFVRVPVDGRYVRLIAFGETAALEHAMPGVMTIARSVSVR